MITEMKTTERWPMLKPGAQPRGKCPVCGKSVALRKTGVLREHGWFRSDSGKCEGSGKDPDGDR